MIAPDALLTIDPGATASLPPGLGRPGVAPDRFVELLAQQLGSSDPSRGLRRSLFGAIDAESSEPRFHPALAQLLVSMTGAEHRAQQLAAARFEGGESALSSSVAPDRGQPIAARLLAESPAGATPGPTPPIPADAPLVPGAPTRLAVPTAPAGASIVPTPGPGDPTLAPAPPARAAIDPVAGAGSPALAAGNPALAAGNPGLAAGSPTLSPGDPATAAANPASAGSDPALVPSAEPSAQSAPRGETAVAPDPGGRATDWLQRLEAARPTPASDSSALRPAAHPAPGRNAPASAPSPAPDLVDGARPIFGDGRASPQHDFRDEGARDPRPQADAVRPALPELSELRTGPSATPIAAAEGAERPSPNLPAARVPQALGAWVDQLAREGGGTARLRVTPPNLGELQLSVRVRGNRVEVAVVAREAAVGALVEAGRERLGEALASRDLRMDSFDVIHGPRDPGDAPERDGRHAGRDFRQAGEDALPQQGDGTFREPRGERFPHPGSAQRDAIGGLAPFVTTRSQIQARGASRVDLRV